MPLALGLHPPLQAPVRWTMCVDADAGWVQHGGRPQPFGSVQMYVKCRRDGQADWRSQAIISAQVPAEADIS